MKAKKNILLLMVRLMAGAFAWALGTSYADAPKAAIFQEME